MDAKGAPRYRAKPPLSASSGRKKANFRVLVSAVQQHLARLGRVPYDIRADIPTLMMFKAALRQNGHSVCGATAIRPGIWKNGHENGGGWLACKQGLYRGYTGVIQGLYRFNNPV